MDHIELKNDFNPDKTGNVFIGFEALNKKMLQDKINEIIDCINKHEQHLQEILTTNE